MRPQVPHLLELPPSSCEGRGPPELGIEVFLFVCLAFYSATARSLLPPSIRVWPVPCASPMLHLPTSPPLSPLSPALSLSHSPESLLKQCADIFVKTNLIFFPFWDRWKEIDVFISNRKKKKKKQYTSSPFDSHFLGTKAFLLSGRLSL